MRSMNVIKFSSDLSNLLNLNCYWSVTETATPKLKTIKGGLKHGRVCIDNEARGRRKDRFA